MRDVGYLIVYLSWSCGLLATIGAAARFTSKGSEPLVDPPSRLLRGALLATVALLLSSLALPWIVGPEPGGRGQLELTGWEGLDPLSLAGIVTLSVVLTTYVVRTTAGGDDHALLLRTTAGCVLGLVAGNTLIQLAQAGGSRLAWGALVSLVLSTVIVVLVGVTSGQRPGAASRPSGAFGARSGRNRPTRPRTVPRRTSR